jgi:CSLREA domain-containing protein
MTLRGTRRHTRVACACVVVLVSLGLASSAAAATFTVTRTDDPDNGTGDCATTDVSCSLREAINTANAAAGGGDVISLQGEHLHTHPVERAAHLHRERDTVRRRGLGHRDQRRRRDGDHDLRFKVFGHRQRGHA